MFSFRTYTDDELHELNNPSLLSDGEYKFVVTDAEPQTSKAGSAMLKVSLSIGDRNITDYLLTEGKMAFKFKHFCNAINAPYNAGKFDTTKVIGKKGKCLITTQQGNLKADGTRYADKNVVKDYIKSEHQEQIMITKPKDDDDIPF